MAKLGATASTAGALTLKNKAPLLEAREQIVRGDFATVRPNKMREFGLHEKNIQPSSENIEPQI